MVYCPECGTKNLDSASFCGNCGYNFQKQSQPSYQQQQQPPSYQQQPPPSYTQPNYQQPSSVYSPIGGPGMGQYMMMRKGKAGPMILSCFCVGLGLLMVDSDRYLGKGLGLFIGSIILGFLIPFIGIIPWIVGLVWTSQAIDEYNRNLASQYGVPIY